MVAMKETRMMIDRSVELADHSATVSHNLQGEIENVVARMRELDRHAHDNARNIETIVATVRELDHRSTQLGETLARFAT